VDRLTPQQLAAAHGIGTVDEVTAGRVAGWAWDPAQPDASVQVDVFDGDEHLTTVRAGLDRPDLQALGMGNGRHGFAIEFGPAVLPLALHRIHVRRRADGTELHRSPWTLRRDEAGFDASASAQLARQVAAECARARLPADLGPALATLSAQLGLLLQHHRSLTDRARDAARVDLPTLLDAATPAAWLQATGIRMAEAYPPRALPVSPQPRVSVVVPVFNHFALTYACVRSIAEHLPAAAFEVIVVDDGSSDETLLAPLVFGGSVRVLRNERNLGFVGACNRGAAAARGEYLFFLNHDTLVRPGWLDELLATFEADPRVGIAGARLLNADGSLQEAGGIVWQLGDAWNWGRGADPEAPAFCHLREVDYVSGAALMIPAALFAQLGGFDEHFAPAYYEDTDLCFRVRQAGRRVVVQPLATIVHLEGQTAGTDAAGHGVKRHQTINRRKFFARWRDTLASQHRANGESPELACERGVQRRALFIDDLVPTPDQDAGSLAAWQHIRALMRLGYKVTLLPSANLQHAGVHTERLQRMGVEVLHAPHVASVEQHLRERRTPLDLVYLHRFGNASQYTGLVRRLHPAARVLYNVADLHHLRLQREAALKDDAALAAAAGRLRAQELAAVAAADVTVVHSAAEQVLLAEAVPHARVSVVPWPYPVTSAASADLGSGVLFVGGYRHSPNLDAALWLLREVMPLVWRELPRLVCTLVGSHMPDELRALGSLRVEVPGQVPDLAPLYRQRRVAVAPLRFGAGIKGKVLEAFAAGRPCVMTGIAAEGLALPDPVAALVHDDAEGLARAIVALHHDDGRCALAADAGRQLIATTYSEAAVDAALTHALV
jgi:GT2 family glycosyltransferase/glycosyltransferase involved in cell wall biosynthesis